MREEGEGLHTHFYTANIQNILAYVQKQKKNKPLNLVSRLSNMYFKWYIMVYPVFKASLVSLP